METIDNTTKNRYELKVGDHIAFIDYKVGKSGNVYLVHTEVPNEITRKGVGRQLVEEALEILNSEKKKIIPSCPFIKKFLRNNPGKFDHLLVEGVKLD